MIFEPFLLNLLVTVWIRGKPPIIERLPEEYQITDGWQKCQKAADALARRSIKRKNVTINIECVPALTRRT